LRGPNSRSGRSSLPSFPVTIRAAGLAVSVR
jgi:hypothetical protein